MWTFIYTLNERFPCEYFEISYVLLINQSRKQRPGTQTLLDDWIIWRLPLSSPRQTSRDANKLYAGKHDPSAGTLYNNPGISSKGIFWADESGNPAAVSNGVSRRIIMLCLRIARDFLVLYLRSGHSRQVPILFEQLHGRDTESSCS